MAEDRNLELKSVVAKFNQSSLALDSLTEKLSALSSASVEISRAEHGISESHRQVKKMADEVTALSFELRKANDLVKTAIESVATFLNQTELGAMKQGIDNITVAINDQIKDLNKKLEAKSQHVQDLNSQISALKTKIDAVPEKFKKKIGWSV